MYFRVSLNHAPLSVHWHVALIALVAVGYGRHRVFNSVRRDPAPVWDENLSPVRALPTFVIGTLISRYYQFAGIPHALGVGLFCIAVLMMSVHANTYVILILFHRINLFTASGYSDHLETIFERPMCLALGNASYRALPVGAVALESTLLREPLRRSLTMALKIKGNKRKESDSATAMGVVGRSSARCEIAVAEKS